MERNRRIGKAYARVPIVTIDGSHELSYDGYKLALNGFENPDRDARTEECRKRIGKGIRIKMDNFGNILIKRLSKSGIFVKEWLQTPGQVTNGSSSNTGRMMPSRQQLIKNQNAMLAAMNSGTKQRQPLGSQIASSISTNSITPSGSSSSGGSSLELPNDSAICDEVLSVGGRLDQDKIYVMFDMKKFQANITQELCRPNPDKRKLEQQCFSIVGLAKDADEVLDLPCWVMVINIVAIEMLNERFPLMSTTGYPETLAGYDRTPANPCSRRAPNFVSIFEGNNSQGKTKMSRDDVGSKEEDPYSLPANASSSDVKSSLNDYGTSSEARKVLALEQNSRYYDSKRAELMSSKREPTSQLDFQNSRYRSKSNSHMHPGQPNRRPSGTRYNHSSSIYSPGHMLIPPSISNGDPVPPKLPPRRELNTRRAKSKSSSSIYEQEGNFMSQPAGTLPADDAIYSTGLNDEGASALETNKTRKPKRNRFLESLKAPLELAKSSSNKSSSSSNTLATPDSSPAAQESLEASGKSGKNKQSFAKTGSRNLRSLLGVKGKTKELPAYEDTSNYMSAEQRKSSSIQQADKLSILEQQGGAKKSTSTGNESADIDSAVDSNEDADVEQQLATGELSKTSSSNSFNDLDIPTPDYETDENIYALEESNYCTDPSGAKIAPVNKANSRRDSGLIGAKSTGLAAAKQGSRGLTRGSKYDLYYSGYRAHVPAKSGARVSEQRRTGALEEQTCIKQLAPSSRSQLTSHSRAPSMAKVNQVAREPIYGSSNVAGARYRSASMQRFLPRSGESMVRLAGSDMYQELELENPYAIGGAAVGGSVHDMHASHYGFTGVPGAGAHRRRSNSKSQSSQIYGLNPLLGSGFLRQAAGAGMASSNYDIGRSSSGIYGNNSSSSSSDYADWQPQMRKVNSSGYLNSIFKSHRGSPSEIFNAHPQQQQQLSNKPTKLPTNNHNSNKGSQLAVLQAVYNNNAKTNGNSGTSSSTNNNNLDQSTLLRKNQAGSRNFRPSRQSQSVAKQLQPSQPSSGPTFRSYDSSNGKLNLDKYCSCQYNTL